jgi:hypothetical protein
LEKCNLYDPANAADMQAQHLVIALDELSLALTSASRPLSNCE